MTAWADDKELEGWLLERYCSDTASPEETAHIEAWFREYPEQRIWYEQFKADLRKGGFSPFTAERRNAAWSEILREARLRCPETEAVLMALVQPGAGVAGPADQAQPLRQIVRTVLDRFAGSAMAALFGRKVTTLTAEELERLRELVEHAGPEDE